MKTLTYAAAIALLAAGTAFAQTNTNNSSTINNSTPTPAARGPAEGSGGASSQSGTMMNRSGSMDQSTTGRSDRSGGMNTPDSMNQSSNIDHARGKTSSHASTMRSKANRHVASMSGRSGADAKENQETMQLNRQQLAGADRTNAGISGGNTYGESGYNSQTAQSPNERGNPPMPTQRNPAINSVPQQRTYGTSPR